MLKPKTWKISRGEFIKAMVAAGAITQLPLLYKCSKPQKRINYKLTDKEYGIAMVVQRILLPESASGPSANEMNGLKHMQWVLNDKRYDPERKDYLLSGLEWVDETAHEQHGKAFLILLEQDKQQLIKHIAATGWGEDWLSTMLTIVLEALLLDPIYDVNHQQAGWKWLEHEPGFPRPDKNLKYDEIFETVAQNTPKHEI